MSLFSQRKGLKSIRSVVQRESMDKDLRTALWNAFYVYYWEEMSSIEDLTYFQILRHLANRLWVAYFKQPIDEMSLNGGWFTHRIREEFFKCEWNEVYDLMEATIKCYDDEDRNTKFMGYCNEVLERELSAYRFISSEIVEITSEQEIVAIEDALNTAPKPVQLHLQQALEHFSDRTSPDYRNSIKESISAVESICKQIANNPKTTLGAALSEIERQQKVAIHPALIEGFKNLYGYTSDANGIRHALMDEPNLSAEDAKFMLVSCSAFINYLIEKAQKAGIKL